MNLNKMLLSSFQVTMIFGDKELAIGTAFLYKHKKEHYLVSNWHVFSGKHSETGKAIDKRNAGLPNKMHFIVPSIEENKIKLQQLGICLQTSDTMEEGTWYEHPKEGNRIDIGVIPFHCSDELGSQNTWYSANDFSNAKNMRVSAGDDVIIIGFPLKLDDNNRFPIMKKGMISSWPDLKQPSFLIDATTRSGMSGSPVFKKSDGWLETENGTDFCPGTFIKFLGIYSGRLSDNDTNAFLGRVWKEDVLIEVIEGKKRFMS